MGSKAVHLPVESYSGRSSPTEGVHWTTKVGEIVGDLATWFGELLSEELAASIIEM